MLDLSCLSIYSKVSNMYIFMLFMALKANHILFTKVFIDAILLGN